MDSLETSPAPAERRRERRWALVCLALLVLALVAAAVAVNQLRKLAPPATAPVNHGPLPEGVRTEVLALLQEHLLDPRLEETTREGVREFHIKGRSRAPLAQEFHAAFKPVVAGRLMPLLRPYGEIISFDIAALDLPPARLRPLPRKD